MEDRFIQLLAIAPFMRATVEDPAAQIGYDLFADALVWTDELPIIPASLDLSTTCLRPILHYRTSLILQNTKEKYQKYWVAAEELFPAWPGFNPGRRACSLKLIYEQLRRSSQESFDSLTPG